MFSRKDRVYMLVIISFCLFAALAFSDQPQEPSSNQYQTSNKIQHNQIELTEEEKTFLQSHPVIQLGTDETWEPFVSRGTDGILRGVDVDFIRYINESTGSNIQLVTGRWADIVKKAKNREIDGLVTSAPLKAREPFFNFSDVYVSEFMIVIIPFDSPLKIKNLSDLSGKTVAIQKANEAYAALLKLYPAIKVMEADSEIESAKMVVEGKADASITGTSTYKATHRRFLKSIKIGYVVSEKPLDLVFSIRKDWPELITIINKSLASMPQETVNAIYLRWFGMSPPEPRIQGKPSIRTIIVDNYYPYTFVNESGEPDGFSVDLMRAVAQVMGFKIGINVGSWEQARNGLKAGEIDFLPMMAYSKERDKEFDFSAPHTIAYDAFFTRKDSPEIRSLNDLRQKKIIVMKNDQAHDYLRSLGYIKNDQLILTDDLQDSLRMLAAGKGDAALMPKLVGLIFIKKLKLTNLELAPLVIEEYKRPFSIAVNEGNQELLERFGQGLSILKETHRKKEIYEKWFGGNESEKISFTDVLKYLLWFILAFILIGSALIFWSLSLKRQVSIRTKDLKEEIDERKQVEEALRESEDKFRSFAEQSIVGIYLISDGVLKYVNPKFAEIFGYSIDECLDNMHFPQLVHPEDLATVEKQLGRRVSGEIKAVRYSFRGIKKNSETIHVEIFGSSMFLNGKIAATGTMLDITDRKQAEEEREQLQDKLHRAHKVEAIGTLAGGVAHDLNNILGGLVSYPELLLLQLPEDSPLRKSILTIQKSGEKAAAVVQDLLTLARRGVVTTEVVNLNNVIADYLKSPEHEKLQSYHPGVHLETHLKKDVLNILGSSTHLSKTVMNLVSNAAEAMPEGGKISVSMENRYIDRAIRGYEDVKEGDYVVITIADTGTGISPDDIEKIFEPFYTKKKMGRSGTGLGMAVVWGTVKDHNGYIDVQSTEGKGTTFTLYFPVTREKLPEDESSLPIESYRGNGESILIVDDVEEQRNIASGMLRELGYSVVSVSSGEEAVEYLKTNKVDLLVLDMIMDPGMDGLDTYKKILELHPAQKAIIASGFSETDRVTEAQSLGARAYIRKPFLLEKIGLAVNEELEK